MIDSESHVTIARLWPGEQQRIAEIARSVPDNGTIVEIGTAERGSALIFHEATKDRGILYWKGRGWKTC